MNQKTICLVSAGLGNGGMERSLTSLANHFAQKKDKVVILSLFKTDVFFDLDPRIEIIWPKIDRKKYHRLVYAILLLPFIRREIKKLNPNTVLSFGEYFNAYVILATRFLSIPIFISDRMGPMLKLGFLLDNANKLLYRYASGIIAQTQKSKEIIQRRTGAKNIIVIHNPVNTINVDVSIKQNKIVSVGRLSREKGHQFLIKAFGKLNNSNYTLHIVGDGNQKENLQELCNQLNIADKVTFHGHLKNFEHILADAKIFVLPSLYEGFPNALLEAMSVPLACISSNCIAGPSEIIQNNVNGILVEPGSEEEIFLALQKLTANENLILEMATKAYNVRHDFEFNKLANQYYNYILN